MVYDIEYFSETIMASQNLWNFENSLPEHLKEIFSKIWNNGYNYSSINILQGYNATSEYGVKQIAFWYGPSKRMHILPVIGTIVWGIHKGLQDSNWHTLFFDNLTGDILDENEALLRKEKNYKALLSNHEGKKLYAEQKYEAAVQKFELSYVSCDDNYMEKGVFFYNSTKSKTKWAGVLYEQGLILLGENRFEEAVEKFEKAESLTNIAQEKIKYSDAQASTLLQIGANLEKKEFHEAALQKYYEAKELAREELTINYIKNFIGVHLAKQAEYCFDEKKYALAFIKFEEAINQTASKKTEYQEWRKKIEKILKEKEDRNSDVFGSLEYDFLSQDIPMRHSEKDDNTKNNPDSYKNYNDTEDLKLKADLEFEKKEYDNARVLYVQALNACKDDFNKEILQDYIKMAENELIVVRMKQEGDKFFRKSNFDQAIKLYEDASVLTKISETAEYLLSLRQVAQIEQNAKEIKEKGDAIYKTGDFQSALVLYKEAYIKSKMDQEQLKYLELIKETDKKHDQDSLSIIIIDSEIESDDDDRF